jgi:hypothetical protein
MLRSTLNNKRWYKSMRVGIPIPAYELITTTIGTGSSDTITFDVTGLGSIYKHLQLRATGQTTVGNSKVNVRFNGDTGSNYSHHLLRGDGLNVLQSATSNATFIFVGNTAVSTQVVGAVIDVMDPFSSTKNTTIKSLYGSVGPNEVGLASGIWRNTATVNSITIYAADAGRNFTSASRFSLYGVRA